MTTEQAVDVIRESLRLMLLISAPILVSAIAIGLTVSIFQAVTQIQEQTLSFVPKIVGMALVAIFVAPWIATLVVEFSRRMFSGAP